MAIETFTWTPDDEAGGDSTLRTRKSQFGDNYAQVSTDGLNAESDSWALSFGGLADEIALSWPSSAATAVPSHSYGQSRGRARFVPVRVLPSAA